MTSASKVTQAARKYPGTLLTLVCIAYGQHCPQRGYLDRPIRSPQCVHDTARKRCMLLDCSSGCCSSLYPAVSKHGLSDVLGIQWCLEFTHESNPGRAAECSTCWCCLQAAVAARPAVTAHKALAVTAYVYTCALCMQSCNCLCLYLCPVYVKIQLPMSIHVHMHALETLTAYFYTCAGAQAGVCKAVSAYVYTYPCVKGCTAHLQHALQLLVDWLEHQLHLITPSWPLARQAHPGSREHRHGAAA